MPKKYIIRCFSLNLVLAVMLLLANGFTAFALDKTISISSVFDKNTVETGETVTQTIGFSDAVGVVNGIRAFNITAEYDSEKLLVSAIDIDPLSNIIRSELIIHNDSGKLAILYADSDGGASPAISSGDLFVITYEPIADSSGTSTVVLSSGDMEFFIDCAYLTSNDNDDVAVRIVLPSFPENETLHVNEGYFYTASYEKCGTYIGVPFLNVDIEAFLADLIPLNGAELCVRNATTGAVGTGMILDVLVDLELIESYDIAVKGDLSGNGLLEINDLVLLKKQIVSQAPFDEITLYASDLTGDNDINSFDIIAAKKIILGITETALSETVLFED